ncbi:DUF5694 domain-containing protein [Erythrobacter sp. T5W1-R]|uniref:DUF5694 domain-containing protein n=1 Tax=Erythrobacter sp. T5W1-R TaxID=3101752 RepID=UPI002AFF3AB1|nr:DUF5694 domain-containing protein [Erythrobacter sp. T5W1-R]MEA1617658.1 DUF5694 domain-containing protein [Erythrobacter sp. T5W1-R]
MKGFVSLALLGFSSVFGAAGASAQEFSPREYQRDIENPTQVMVLGTAHLSNAAEDWDPKVLDLLLDRLASFKPDVIAIENQRGPTASKLWSYRSIYPEAAATFAGRALLMATVAGLSLDMDMPQAEAELRRHIGKVGDNPTPAARRRSAALFAASGDPYSALVQWLRLPSSERVPGDGVSRRLAALLEDLGGERGEGVLLAARLAVRLGLERLYQIDSQEEDVLTPEESDVFAQKVFPLVGERYNADPAAKERGKIEDMTTPDSALAAYRKLNDDRIERRLSEIEWLGAMKEQTEGDVGRKRVAAWESRNLRMAANIREASARAPGGRVLVIVGATHKIWLEAYLGMMSDIEIVSTDTVLK